MICKSCGKEIEDGHLMCPSCGTLVEISSMSFSGINWGSEDNQGTAGPEKSQESAVVMSESDAIIKTPTDSILLDGVAMHEIGAQEATTEEPVPQEFVTLEDAPKENVTQQVTPQIEAVQKLATVLNLIREKKIAEIQAVVKARNNGERIVASKVEKVAEIPPEVDLQHQLFSMLGHQLSQENLEGKLREEHEKLRQEERERQLQEELKQWRAKREASQQRWREEQGRQASQQRWCEEQERQAKRREEEKRQALENIKRERLEKNRIEQQQAAADPPSPISKLKTKIADKWNGLFYGMSEGEKIVRIIKFVLIILLLVLGYFAEKDREYHSYEQAHKRWEVVEKGLENYHPEDRLDDKLKSLLNGQTPLEDETQAEEQTEDQIQDNSQGEDY